MLTFYDSQNAPVKLTQELGRGGEGTVYLAENENLVGKIYHEAISAEKAEKLRWMATRHSDQLLKTTVWLQDILQDAPNGKVVGFLMPKIRAKEIHELYSPKSRRVHFPDATWHFLIHTATNLARAFNNLHREGHVMGDVNQGNCVVTAAGLVKLIDCDSYEIKTETKTFPCEVGVTTHIPPELQKKNLRGIDRTENHDNFGLAVIIFQLLFLGRHPFSGNYLGAQDKTIEEAITEHLFVYGRDAARKNIVQPPGTPPLSAVSNELAELFERAFSEENERPQPSEWVAALESLANNLRQCLLNPGHVFYAKLAVCPWCEIEEETGLILFPFTVSSNALSKRYERDFSVATVENLIENFSTNLTPDFSARIPTVNPTAAFIAERQRLNRNILISIAIALAYLIGAYFFEFTSSLWFIAILAGSAFSHKEFKEFRQKERQNYEDLKSEREYFESVFFKSSDASDFNKSLNATKIKLGQYNLLKSERTSHYIEEPTESREKLAQKLEKEITESLVSLRSASVKYRRSRQKFIDKTRENLKKLAQAQANVKHLGLEIPIPQIIIGATVVLSFFMPSYNESAKNSASSIQDKPSAVYERTLPVNPKSSKLPPFSISDKEISDLSTGDRKEKAIEIYQEANRLFVNYNYQEAEKHFKFSLRFDPENARTLGELGINLSQSGKYAESLEYLKKASAIESNDTYHFYEGINYLKLNKFEEARKVFATYNDLYVPTGSSYFNLGLAYQGLGNHKKAVEELRKSVETNASDTEAWFQLGISLNKIGDIEGVKEVYQKLLEKTSSNAAKLKQAVGNTVDLDSVTPSYGIGTGADNIEPPPPVTVPRKTN